MNLKEQLKLAKEQGISIKLIANLSNINVSTLYAFSSGKRNLSPEKEEKVIKVLNSLLLEKENK